VNLSPQVGEDQGQTVEEIAAARQAREEELEAAKPPLPLIAQLVNAASSGDVASITSLLAQRANVNDICSEGMSATPLIAAAGKHTAAVEALLHANADPNITNKPETNYWITTALETAVKGDAAGKKERVQLLIDATADVDTPHVSMNTASILHWAVSVDNDPEITALLAANSKDLSAAARHCNGSPVLHQCVFWDKNADLRVLVQAGADMEETSTHCGSALTRAIQRGAMKCFHTLLELRADPNSANNYHSALMLAAEHTGIERSHEAETRATEMTTALLVAGADPNAIPADSRDGGPLHVAARAGRPLVVAVLLERGADPKRTDKAGRTPEVAASNLTADHPVLQLLRGAGS